MYWHGIYKRKKETIKAFCERIGISQYVYRKYRKGRIPTTARFGERIVMSSSSGSAPCDGVCPGKLGFLWSIVVERAIGITPEKALDAVVASGADGADLMGFPPDNLKVYKTGKGKVLNIAEWHAEFCNLYGNYYSYEDDVKVKL